MLRIVRSSLIDKGTLKAKFFHASGFVEKLSMRFPSKITEWVDWKIQNEDFIQKTLRVTLSWASFVWICWWAPGCPLSHYQLNYVQRGTNLASSFHHRRSIEVNQQYYPLPFSSVLCTDHVMLGFYHVEHRIFSSFTDCRKNVINSRDWEVQSYECKAESLLLAVYGYLLCAVLGTTLVQWYGRTSCRSAARQQIGSTNYIRYPSRLNYFSWTRTIIHFCSRCR